MHPATRKVLTFMRLLTQIPEGCERPRKGLTLCQECTERLCETDPEQWVEEVEEGKGRGK